jgi:multisubunit Na+/H+ antiporter MnhB subunit
MPALTDRLLKVGLHGSLLAALHLFSAAGFMVIVFVLDWQTLAFTQNVVIAITSVLTYGAVYFLMRRLGSPIMFIDRLWMAGAILFAAIVLEALLLYSMAPADTPFQFVRSLGPDLPQQFTTHILCVAFNLSAFRAQN